MKKEYIAMDVHKSYSLMERESHSTGETSHKRIEHHPGAIQAALHGIKRGTPVAIEATGNWYWVADEIEAAGLQPLLVNPAKAKTYIGNTNKTDKLDVHGLNRLQRNGTLPTVWIPPAELRDLRELTRVRMVFSSGRTKLKNRINAILSKYNKTIEASDIFGKKGQLELKVIISQLPEQTAWTVQLQLEQLNLVQSQLNAQEKRLKSLITVTPEIQRLMTMPGIAVILGTTIALEIGDVFRFPDSGHLAAYAGTTPRVISSGGRTRYGKLRTDVNHTLKWAFSEAANSVAVNHQRFPERHVSNLYRRLRARKGHAKAIGAVSRHLAESAYYVLSRQESYKERGVSSHTS